MADQPHTSLIITEEVINPLSSSDSTTPEEATVIKEIRELADARFQQYRTSILYPLRHASNSVHDRQRAPKIIEKQFRRFQGWTRDTNLLIVTKGDAPTNTRLRRIVLRRYTPREDIRNIRPDEHNLILQCLQDSKRILEDVHAIISETEETLKEEPFRPWSSELVLGTEFAQKFDQWKTIVDTLERLTSLKQACCAPTTGRHTIGYNYERCVKMYEAVVDNFGKLDEDTKKKLSPNAIVHERKRLETWAEYTGVLLGENVSLDYKVHQDPDLQFQFREILHDIEEELHWIWESTIVDEAPDPDVESDMENAMSTYQQRLTRELETSLEVLAERFRSLWNLWNSKVAINLPPGKTRPETVVRDEKAGALTMGIEEDFSGLNVLHAERKCDTATDT